MLPNGLFYIIIYLQASDLIFNNNTMNRNKIEKWILSEHHLKRPTLVFILTLIISVSIVTSMLLYIKYSQ